MNTQNYLARYLRRLRWRQAHILAKSRQWSWLRLGVFILGTLASVFAFAQQESEWGWFVLGLSTLLFILAVRVFQRFQQSLFRHQILIRHLQTQQARLQRNWSELPLPFEAALAVEHPFAKDLDLVGMASLQQLADTCISQEGSQTLVDWIVQRTPDPAQILGRQALVKSLLPRNLFRQGLLLRGAETAWEFRHVHAAGSHWRASELLAILARYPEHARPGKTLAVLTILAAIHWFFQALAWLGWVPSLFWQIPLSMYILFFWLARGQTRHLFQEAFQLDYEVRKLSKILSWLENWAHVTAFKSTLKDLVAVSPRRLFQRLGKVVPLASLQTNPLAWLMMNLALPCDFFAAWQLANIKPVLYAQLPRWIAALAELEAAASLANLAWLHPDWRFPLLTEAEAPLLLSPALGHPLLPPDKRIRNGFRIDHPGQVCLLTGSNMAGKSTFIKSIGVNLALAQAGGAVDAEALNWRPVRLFGCIRVSDSVTDGFSYFYAEVRRLKRLLDELECKETSVYPVFWLIDEIFRGTNNRERFLGSKAYIEALLEKKGAGVISTHDLELTQVAPDKIQNFHFRERIVGQEMVFDYHLQIGPCPTTNALKIMALEGLPVPVLHTNSEYIEKEKSES